MEKAPAVIPATPAITTEWVEAVAPATPATRARTDTMPSLAPRMALRRVPPSDPTFRMALKRSASWTISSGRISRKISWASGSFHLSTCRLYFEMPSISSLWTRGRTAPTPKTRAKATRVRRWGSRTRGGTGRPRRRRNPSQRAMWFLS